MKVTGFVGSPRVSDNTSALVETILSGAQGQGATTKVFNLNQLNIKGCQGCRTCKREPRCAVQDDMQGLYAEIIDSDVLVIGSPIYMWQVTSQTKAFIDRLFAFFRNELSPKVQGKPVILAFSQNQENVDAFKEYTNSVTRLFEFLGYHVVDTLVAGGNMAADGVKNNPVMLEKARTIGKNLIKEES